MNKLICVLFHIVLIGSPFLGEAFNEVDDEPSLDYPVDPVDIIDYIELGKPCDPDNTDPKNGICRPTLYCDRESKLCDCEDTGPYKYTEDQDQCKNYVGSRCVRDDNCVTNAKCSPDNSTCVCDPGQTCKDRKVPVKPR